MAEQDHRSDHSQDLPQVLVLGNQLFASKLEPHFSRKFHFINVSSSIPLHQILTSHHHLDFSSIRALLCIDYAINADVLRLLPSVGLVVTPSTGINHIDLPECRRRGVQVANAGSLYSEDVADMAVGLLTDVMRKITAADRYMRTRVCPASGHNFPLGSKVGGKRVGIVGLGGIGLKVARRLNAFGCMISYNARAKKSFVSYPFYSNVVELAASCNALIICCALNEQTRHIINKEVMLALGKGGVIVNVGRGALIDEEELVKCLMKGEIGGAGLDVFENEPHVPKELSALDNVVLSPHVAAFTSDSIMGVFEVVGQNLEAFFSNKPLITPVLVD